MLRLEGGGCSVGTGSLQRLQPNGWLPVPNKHTLSHTHVHRRGVSPFVGRLPNATFGPNYQVVSITWTASRFPSVKLLMRFGLATARLSICLLTLPFCLSGTRKETGSPRPDSRAAAGKDAML